MSDKINSHKDLKGYQEALLLVKDIYFITSHFPKEELYGLTSQMKRCAISIPSNIAEGSLFELETQLQLSIDLNFLNQITSEKLMLDIIQLQKKI